MAEQSEWRLYEPHLKAHRLVRAADSATHTQVTPAVFVDAEPLAADSQPSHSERLAGWTAGPVLVEQASAIAQGALPLLDALPARLERLKATEAAQPALSLLRSIISTLPDELSAAGENEIERMDWAFSILLNQPNQPGLIEHALIALGAPSEGGTPSALPSEHAAEVEGLRRLHRDLVSLQQGWDAELDALFFPPAPPAPKPLLSGRPKAERTVDAPARANAASRRQIVPMLTPLPPALTITRTSLSAGSSHWLHRARAARMRVLVVMAVLLLMVGSAGVTLVLGQRTPNLSGNSVTVAALQPKLPEVTPTNAVAPTQPAQPTATLSPTATEAPPPAATPQPPAATATPIPQPTSPITFLCPTRNSLCVSSLVLQVPCSGQGSITLQLKNSDSQPHGWQATTSNDPSGNPLVTATPASGQLQPGEVMTLTITQTGSGEDLAGVLSLVRNGSQKATLVVLVVCGG